MADSLVVLPERITRRVIKDDNGCWIWSGAKQKNGYGYTRWKIDGIWKHVRVHRLYYETFIGPIPENLEIDHIKGICFSRACVRPSHLRAVTHQVNLQTRNHRGPPKLDACRKCNRSYTPETTYTHPSGKYRTCRLCRVEYKREWSAKRKRAILTADEGDSN